MLKATGCNCSTVPLRRSHPRSPGLGDPGADSAAEDEIKTGGKKFDEQNYGRKYFSFVLLLVEFFPARFDFRLRPHYLLLGLRGCVAQRNECRKMNQTLDFRSPRILHKGAQRTQALWGVNISCRCRD